GVPGAGLPPRPSAQRTVTLRTFEPSPGRPLSPAHWATKTDEELIRQVVVKLPPLAPATTTWCCQAPPESARRETTICSPPMAPVSVPLTVIVPRTALSLRLVKLRRRVDSERLACAPATSPPELVVNSRRLSGVLVAEVLSMSSDAFIALLTRMPSTGIEPAVITCGCQLSPPSVVRST